MSRWEESFKSHAIHETVSMLEDLLSKNFETDDGEVEIEKRRLSLVIQTIKTALSEIDFEMISSTTLDNLNAQLRGVNFWDQLNAYGTNGGLAHLQNANNNIGPVLASAQPIISSSCPPDSAERTKTLNEAVDSFLKQTDDRFSSFSKSINDAQAEFESKLEKYSQYNNANLEKLEELDQRIESKKAEVEQLVSQWQSQFSEAQDVRAKSYEEWKNTAQSEFISLTSETLAKAEKDLSSSFEEFQNEKGKLLAEINKRHDEILQLHGIVAGDSVAAGYIQNVNDENKAANFWRWATIVFVATTVLWTIFAYVTTPTIVASDFGYWGKVVKALAVTATLIGGAVFASKQSALHRQNENRAKWLALEIKAIDPYIMSLDIEDQRELKKKLSERIFGQSHSGENTAEIDQQALQTTDKLLATFGKNVTDIIKATK
jgi:cell division septum initiation protein DivIVA